MAKKLSKRAFLSVEFLENRELLSGTTASLLVTPVAATPAPAASQVALSSSVINVTTAPTSTTNTSAVQVIVPQTVMNTPVTTSSPVTNGTTTVTGSSGTVFTANAPTVPPSSVPLAQMASLVNSFRAGILQPTAPDALMGSMVVYANGDIMLHGVGYQLYYSAAAKTDTWTTWVSVGTGSSAKIMQTVTVYALQGAVLAGAKISTFALPPLAPILALPALAKVPTPASLAATMATAIDNATMGLLPNPPGKPLGPVVLYANGDILIHGPGYQAYYDKAAKKVTITTYVNNPNGTTTKTISTYSVIVGPPSTLTLTGSTSTTYPTP